MYCPTCGLQQSAERKFCTACGTNLSAVSAALSGNINTVAAAPVSYDDGLAQAQAQYRRELAGAIYKGAPGLGLLVAAAFIFAILPPGVSVWICFGLIIGGISTLGRGIGQYYLATSDLKAAELKAANTSVPLASSPQAQQPPLIAQDPYPPASVTEHTTRHLG